MRALIKTLATSGLMALALGSTSAQAQTPVTGSGWGGYAPASTWGSATPAVTYAPAGTVATFTPQPGSASWGGYAPYTNWNGYNPGVAWQYVDPRAGTRPAYVNTNVVPGAFPRGYGSPVPSFNREFGTGRNVAMAKPWLPGSYRGR
jgi:hypothetical protein